MAGHSRGASLVAIVHPRDAGFERIVIIAFKLLAAERANISRMRAIWVSTAPVQRKRAGFTESHRLFSAVGGPPWLSFFRSEVNQMVVIQ